MLPLFVNVAYVAGKGNCWAVRNSVPVTIKRATPIRGRLYIYKGRSFLIA